MDKSLKFIFILVLSLLILSCSSDDNSNSKLNPPNWLIGTWTNSNVAEGTFSVKTVIASSDDIILIFGNNERKTLSKEANNRNQPIEESFPDDQNYNVFTGVLYQFELISKNQIKIANSSELIYIK